MITITELLALLHGVHKSGNGWEARCPAHEDKRASLSISEGDTGIVLCCHTGCTIDAICVALGIKPADLFYGPHRKRGALPPPRAPRAKPLQLSPSLADEAAAQASVEQRLGPVSTVWDYHDADGTLIGRVLRFDRDGGKKDIRPIARNGDDTWHEGAMPVPRPLYHLPELLANPEHTVYVTEGEKAADAGTYIGLLTTTSSGGANAPDKTDWSPLAGRNVVILPDNDDPGRKYATKVQELLASLPTPTTAIVVALPGLEDKGDLYDFVAARDTIDTDEIKLEIESLCVDEDEPICCVDFIRRHPHMNRPVIDGLLREGEIMNVIAPAKVGKSWLVHSLAYAISSGRPWLGQFNVAQGNVLLLDNELQSKTLSHRLATVGDSLSLSDDEKSGLYVRSLRGRLRDINQLRPSLLKIEPNTYQLVIIDAFYRALPVGSDENDNAGMAMIYNTLDEYAQRLNAAFCLIHHSSKGSQADKAVTDVGSGAGSMSRAADTHLILRRHEQDNVAVLDAAVRSWAPIKPTCMVWEYPLWRFDFDLDPTALYRPPRRGGTASSAASQISTADFAIKYLRDSFRSRSEITLACQQDGISLHRIKDFLSAAVSEGYADMTPPIGRSPSTYRKRSTEQ